MTSKHLDTANDLSKKKKEKKYFPTHTYFLFLGMAEEDFNEQRNLVPEALNFSINDILNGSTDVNDSSFQSIVQTLSDTNNDPNITPSFANLPAELQDFFSASDTDDLLSSQHSAHDLLFEPQPFIQPVRMNVPPPVLAPAQQNNMAQGNKKKKKKTCY